MIARKLTTSAIAATALVAALTGCGTSPTTAEAPSSAGLTATCKTEILSSPDGAYVGDYLGYAITITNGLSSAAHLDGWVVAFNTPDGSQNGWDSQTDSTVIEAGQTTTVPLVPGYDGWNPMTGGSELYDSCVVLKVAGEPL